MTLLAFLHPLFLWGALAFLVPLIIHLINRRRYKTVTWAAMDFLLSAYKKRNRRMRLENLLLLLLRCAIPLILALAVARPYFGADHPLSLIANNRREVVVVIDESYSMNRRVAGGTLFQTAKAQVIQLLDGLALDRGDTCTIVTMGVRPRILVQRSTARPDLDRALRRLERPSFEAADLRRTVDLLASDVLPEIPTEQEVYFFTDLQRGTFEEPLTDAGKEGALAGSSAGVRQKLMDFTREGARLCFVHVAAGTSAVQNATVEDLRMSESLAITNQSVRIVATIHRRGDWNAAGGACTFRIGERELVRTFSYDNEGRATVEVYHSFPAAGDHAVEFLLDEDDLIDDNSRVLRVPVRTSLPVLVVDGDPAGGDPADGETWNLLLTLDPLFGEHLSEGRRYFEPTWMTHHEFNRAPKLDGYQAIILANVREIEEERMVPELENFVRRGGGVWFFLGEQVRPESYNDRLYRADGTGLLPVPLAPMPRGELPGDTAAESSWTESWFRMQVEDELHPMVRTFIDDRIRGHLRSPVFRFLPFEMTEPPPDALTVVLSYSTAGNPQMNEPALLDWSLGRGHVAWFNTTADRQWSLFADTAPAFFPLVWDVTSYLTREDGSGHLLGIGDAIQKAVPVTPESYSITLPTGEVQQFRDMPREMVLGYFALPPFEETWQPGVYALEMNLNTDELPQRELFAVNVDPREGDLEMLGREELSSLLDPIPFSYETEITQRDETDAGPRQGEIWKSLMLALLIFLLLESFLSWRFGAYG